MNIKKGELDDDTFDVLMYDLECIEFDRCNEQNTYHYDMLRTNLHDLFGKKMPKDDHELEVIE